MKIIIKDNYSKEIILKDPNAADDAFVEVVFWEEEGAYGEITVPLSELMAAVICFDAKRSRRLSEESN